jgi:hypothetical protein
VTRRLRTVLIVLLSLVGVIAVAIGGLVVALRHPLPQGVAGPAADDLARAVERAVNKTAWDRTGAVRWTFRGKHQHLWDRTRQLSRVRFADHEVLVDLTRRTGRAYRRGAEVTGPKAAGLVKRAYGYFINDSFWLNPLTKLFDPGVERLLVQAPDGPALLIRYTSGGLTPGDSYLWLAAPDGTPRAWRLWVSILPLPGLEFSWEGWITLSTGARVSTVHRSALLRIPLTDVAGAATLAELEPGPDPFAPLAQPH